MTATDTTTAVAVSTGSRALSVAEEYYLNGREINPAALAEAPCFLSQSQTAQVFLKTR